jgi:beta-glucosidase
MPVDLVRQASGGVSLHIEYRVDEKPTEDVQLALSCGEGCGAIFDVTSTLASSPIGQWRALSVRLADFAKAGADLSKVVEPFRLATNGRLGLTIKTVILAGDATDAVALPSAGRGLGGD